MQDIFSKLDKIMKSQEKIQTRLDTLEQAYFDSGKQESTSRSGSVATQNTYGQRWTEQEHAVFLKCLEKYPRSAAQQIASVVKTKSAKQVTSHAQKFYEKLDRYYEKPSVKGQEETRKALK